MVSGSNQEVKIALWWNGCMGGWWHLLEWSFSICIPAFTCPGVPGTKTCRGQESQVISSLCINPALRHSLHMTLIPHLSEAKTCLAFDSERLTSLVDSWPELWPSGPRIAEQHQRHGQTTLLCQTQNESNYELAWLWVRSIKHLISFNNGVVLKLMNQKWIIIHTNLCGQGNVRVLDPWCITE